MKKILVLFLLILFVSSNNLAHSFGSGFNIQLSGEGTRVQGFGMMNGSNSQGSIPILSKNYTDKNDGIIHHQIAEGLFVIVVRNKNKTFNVVPYLSSELEKNFDVYKKTNALIAINAGYFDPKNKKTTAFVTKDFEEVANPKENENLVNNEKLKPHLGEIFNRSEFRILQKGNKIKYDIAKHYEQPQGNWQIKHAIQAGPMLMPNFNPEEEYFLVTENGKVTRDAISVTKKAARTAIGYKGDDLYIIIATVKHPMTLLQLSKLCAALKLDEAMNFDGGGSTSFDSKKLHIVSDKDEQARRLKSFLLIKNND